MIPGAMTSIFHTFENVSADIDLLFLFSKYYCCTMTIFMSLPPKKDEALICGMNK